MKYYCKKCGQYVEDDYIEKAPCPHCGYEDVDGYKIIGGHCGKCGKHLTDMEIKYKRCMDCNIEFIEEPRYRVTYTQRKKAYIIFGIIGAIFVMFNIKNIINTIITLGALAILIGVFELIITIIAKCYQMEIRTKYDFYHQAVHKSPFYKEKYHIDDDK